MNRVINTDYHRITLIGRTSFEHTHMYWGTFPCVAYVKKIFQGCSEYVWYDLSAEYYLDYVCEVEEIRFKKLLNLV